MQLDNDVHVLARIPFAVPADLDDIILAEQPNAPETMINPLIAPQPMRPPRNAFRYSSVWNIGHHFFGQSHVGDGAVLDLQPLAIRTLPPMATYSSGLDMYRFAI